MAAAGPAERGGEASRAKRRKTGFGGWRTRQTPKHASGSLRIHPTKPCTTRPCSNYSEFSRAICDYSAECFQSFGGLSAINCLLFLLFFAVISLVSRGTVAGILPFFFPCFALFMRILLLFITLSSRFLQYFHFVATLYIMYQEGARVKDPGTILISMVAGKVPGFTVGTVEGFPFGSIVDHTKFVFAIAAAWIEWSSSIEDL